MKFYSNLKNQEKGITLIALIITIVVLLILAGITIANITGGEGIIEQASTKKDDATIANEKQILSNAVITASNESKFGEINENNLRDALKDNITEIKGITENGPWKVTSSKSGINYLIKQNYEVIQFPENTGTGTEMGIQIGDFVNYKAGNWTQQDLEKLGVKFDSTGNITDYGPIYMGEDLFSDTANRFKFGGFTNDINKVIDKKITNSKDESINVYSSSNGSSDGIFSGGWRVLNKNDDGSINIVHAGTPEGFWHYNQANKSLQIFNDRDWSMYEDNLYCISGTARLLKKEEIEAIPQNNSLRKNGNYYYLPLFYNSGGLYYVNNSGYLGGWVLYALGIRPVVTLKAECLFQNVNDENTTTHNTQETAWNLVI